MAITIIKVENPFYSKADNSMIDVMLTTKEHGVIPYTAGIIDNEIHGKQLWIELLAGKHGAIAPYRG